MYHWDTATFIKNIRPKNIKTKDKKTIPDIVQEINNLIKDVDSINTEKFGAYNKNNAIGSLLESVRFLGLLDFQKDNENK